jgi:cyanophycin synthetase
MVKKVCTTSFLIIWREKVGVYAGKAAVRIAQALIDAKEYDLTEDIQEMRELREKERLGSKYGIHHRRSHLEGNPMDKTQ